MKLEMNKGLAILKATTKKESERLMLYYLGKTPATQEVPAKKEEPVREKRVYKHSKAYKLSRSMKKTWSEKPKQSCSYGCGDFKNLPAHMLQKHGQGKNGVPRTPNLHLGKNAGTPATPRREYLSLPDLPSARGR